MAVSELESTYVEKEPINSGKIMDLEMGKEFGEETSDSDDCEEMERYRRRLRSWRKVIAMKKRYGTYKPV